MIDGLASSIIDRQIDEKFGQTVELCDRIGLIALDCGIAKELATLLCDHHPHTKIATVGMAKRIRDIAYDISSGARELMELAEKLPEDFSSSINITRNSDEDEEEEEDDDAAGEPFTVKRTFDPITHE